MKNPGIDLNSVFRFRFVFVFLRSVFVSPLLQNEIKTKTANEIAKTPFRSIPGTQESSPFRTRPRQLKSAWLWQGSQLACVRDLNL